jgi:hypothetical protein
MSLRWDGRCCVGHGFPLVWCDHDDAPLPKIPAEAWRVAAISPGFLGRRSLALAYASFVLRLEEVENIGAQRIGPTCPCLAARRARLGPSTVDQLAQSAPSSDRSDLARDVAVPAFMTVGEVLQEVGDGAHLQIAATSHRPGDMFGYVPGCAYVQLQTADRGASRRKPTSHPVRLSRISRRGWVDVLRRQPGQPLPVAPPRAHN